jgi:DNA-binding NarL/FixJ family response regulator
MERVVASRSVEVSSEAFARRALDVLDVGVIILSADLKTVLDRNAHARQFLGDGPLPQALIDAIDGYVLSRRDTRRFPPAMRLELSGRAFYLRVAPGEGEPPLEIALLREEVLRDVDAFKLLNARYGVSRREYQVLTALRLGKTNRQISTELGIAEATVGRHVHRLLERFEAPNRTALVNRVEHLTAKRV